MKADHDSVKRLLKTARGQIDGILKMIDEDRYCMDIATQLQASQSLLKSAKSKVMKAHINSCLNEAMYSNNKNEKEVKLREIEKFIDTLIKAE